MRGRKLQHGFTFPISESESESEPEPEPESASRHSDQESSLTQEVTSVGSPTSVPILAKSQMSTEVQAKFGTNGSGAESIVASTSETTAVASVSGTSTEAGSALRSSLLNLMERDMLEFNSINEDFIACFEPILCELINNNLLLGIDTGQFDLGSILSNIRPIVYEVKTSYFFEKGFAARIESILSRALIVLPSGSRVMTYAEKVAFIISSMSGVNERIDNFSSDYISALINSDLPTSRDEPAQSSSLGTGEVEEGSKGKGKGKKRKARDEDYDKSNSDLPTSRDESAQSSSLGTGEVEEGSKGKGKGKKRKARDEDYDKSASVEEVHDGRQNPGFDGVPSKFGSMRVLSEFNEDLDRMILEHIGNLREIVRSITVDLESGYPHLAVDVRCNATREQSIAASDRLLSEFIHRIRSVICSIFVYDRGSNTPRVINPMEIEYFMKGLHAEMVAKHKNVLSEELPKKH